LQGSTRDAGISDRKPDHRAGSAAEERAVRIFETKTRPATQYKACVSVTCDLCNAKASSPDEGPDSVWQSEYYDATEVQVCVRLRTGEVFPEDSNAKEVHFDICPSCFQSKLVPWLESQGAKANKRDVGW
jgi:hypothetical protein